MNTGAKLSVIAGMILLVCSACTTIVGKECAFIEISDWSEESKNFLRMPESGDGVYTDEQGIKYYSHAPEFLFEDMKPTFRNNRNAKKYCPAP
jgi:hypothetical protein